MPVRGKNRLTIRIQASIYCVTTQRGDHNRVSRETPRTLLSRPAAPAVSARSNIGGGCTGNIALCWRCITFINSTLGTSHTQYTSTYIHTHIQSTCTREGEKLHGTFCDYLYTARRKRRLLHTWTKQRPVATHACIHLFNARPHIISRIPPAYKL